MAASGTGTAVMGPSPPLPYWQAQALERDAEAELVGDGFERRDVALALLPAGQQANRLGGRQAGSGADDRRRDDAAVLEMGVDAVAPADGLQPLRLVVLRGPWHAPALPIGVAVAHHFRNWPDNWTLPGIPSRTAASAIA